MLARHPPFRDISLSAVRIDIQGLVAQTSPTSATFFSPGCAELLRKLHQRTHRKSSSLLNEEGQARLAAAFEQHNSSRHNIDRVVSAMGAAGGLRAELVLKELKVMGLRFGVLTNTQVG